MSDNQTPLIDHFDNSLHGKGSPEMEQRISNDPAIAEEWHTINLAVDAVRNAGLYEQVGAVKSIWLAQQAAPATPKGAAIRSLYRNTLRVAACIVILTGGAAIFKYTTTSSAGIYEKYYSTYTLNTSRGTGTQSAIEEAYNKKSWTEVVNLFNAAKEKNNQSYFLAGIADLELKKYDVAIDKFQQVIAANVQSGSDYFQDEAEFYLAMSWLGRNDVNEAIPLLEKIRDNKSHLFHDIVAKMSFTDLRIAQYKSHK